MEIATIIELFARAVCLYCEGTSKLEGTLTIADIL
jgi:hypothetical protein